MRKRIFDITPEDQERLKTKRLNQIKSLTAEYQLGVYVGEDIVRKKLPCLSIDMIHTKNVISVTPEEELRAKELNDTWYNNHKDGGDEDPNWLALRAFHKEMEDKYLPKSVECYFSPLNIDNMSEFKRGIKTSLWDCDICHYDIEEDNIDVKITDDYYFTIITLKR
jgi:hypothetical protein